MTQRAPGDKRSRKIARLKHAVIFTSITALGILAYVVGVPFLDLMELKTLDLRFQSRQTIAPGPQVVLAVIDEKSIAAEGKWIWPRSKFAVLVDKLSQAGAAVIAFDIGFLEPDNLQLIRAIEEIQKGVDQLQIRHEGLQQLLAQTRNGKDNDRRLALAIRRSPAKVVLGYFFHKDKTQIGAVPEAVLARHRHNIAPSKYGLEHYASEAARRVALEEPVLPQSNIPIISKAGPYAGYFNLDPDVDGVIRWLPAVYKMENALYAPLSLATVAAFTEKPLEVFIEDYGVREIKIGDRLIPTDEKGRILINYRGKANAFRHVSITDILNDRVEGTDFQGRIVMVGATANAIYDLRVTPFGSIFPGIEIHASVVDSVLAEDFLYRPDWTKIFDILAVLACGTLLGVALPRVSVLPGLAATLLVFSGYILLCQYLFAAHGLVINLVYPLSVVLLVYVSITAYRYFVETRQKRFIKNAFSTYLAPSVVNQLIESPENLKLGGENRDITAFFSDVQGFTSISESLSPKDLVELLNEFLTEMTDIILKHEGTVDKFEGDAIIAFFGAPLVLENHAERALMACVDMQRQLKALRRQWRNRQKPALRMRIGLCSGPAVVGNMGSVNRLDYTMMGDTVNTAARLEGVNKVYGIYTLMSDTTYRAGGDRFAVREIDTVMVAGKKEPVTIYQLLGVVQELDDRARQAVSFYHRGLDHYRQRRWQQAHDAFSRALGVVTDDQPSRVMRHRCHQYQKTPPPADWNGVYDIRTK